MAAILGQDAGAIPYSREDFPGVTLEAVMSTAKKKGMTPDQVISEYAKTKGVQPGDVMGTYGWTPESFATQKAPEAGSKAPPVDNPKWKQGSAEPPPPAEVTPAKPASPVTPAPGFDSTTRGFGGTQGGAQSFGSAISSRIGEAMASGGLEKLPLVVLLMARNSDIPPDQKAAVEAVIAQRQPGRPSTMPSGGSGVLGGR
jgi:hypothetical protein